MLLIGDLEQLAPVVREEEWRMLSQYYASPYFFDSRALKATDYATIELKQVFRQDDMHFVELLNKIRSKNIDDEALSTLNSRCIPNFKPRKEDGYIRLTTHNSFAQATNDREMEALPTKPYTYTATVEGDFPELSYPQYVFNSIFQGAVLSNGLYVQGSIYDRANRLGVQLGLSAEIEKRGVMFHLYGDNPILGYKEFKVNNDNYCFLGNDRRVSANVTLSASDGQGVQLFSDDEDSTALQDLTLTLHRFDLEKTLSVLPYTPNVKGIMDGDFHAVQTQEEFLRMVVLTVVP